MSDADLAFDKGDEFILRDDKMFFAIVRTTPDLIEARDLLSRAKAAVLSAKVEALRVGDTTEDHAMAALITKINMESKYIHEREDRARVKSVIEEIWGKEGVDQYQARRVMRMWPDLRPI